MSLSLFSKVRFHPWRRSSNPNDPIRCSIYLLVTITILVAAISVFIPKNDLTTTTSEDYYSTFILPKIMKKATIAYAVTITHFEDDIMYDDAVVVHKSIQLASLHSKYDYHMIAFVHPDAIICQERMEKFGYEVQIRETPFNETEIQNPTLQKVQKNSCCGAKEYLKLYSYTLLEYPVVVHLDLDTIVLKPLDDLFDLMLDDDFNKSKIPAMWLEPEEFPPRVDFMFTRDYNMVDPPRRQPHQIGVQGGFLVVRPNMTDFDRMVEIIVSGGDFVGGAGWGGRTKNYGGYFGSGTIQGLASYYYGEFATNRSLELNRCYYNTMVDDPMNNRARRSNPKLPPMCMTLQDECEDCRKTNLSDIYTAHFTVCGKPKYCSHPLKWGLPNLEDHYDLCMELFREWHTVRRSVEKEWQAKYSNYRPTLFDMTVTTEYDARFMNFTQGHCAISPKRYYPMEFPPVISDHSTGVLL